MTETETKESTGFQRCLAEWKRVHEACPLSTGKPDSKEIALMRHGYKMGHKDGRAHK